MSHDEACFQKLRDSVSDSITILGFGQQESASFFNSSRIVTSLPANASPLRRRMIDDMRMRQLVPKTQDIYLHIVREFARFLGRSPDTASLPERLHPVRTLFVAKWG
ncbi:hypothetical protein R70211_06837 [Paraburkholderia domus]|uniref:Integrase SAM-like N-terminal domain-containing protein n=1 Tax=Paraburkholderia domus TaxID=2793075 RepID=A0A9N8R7H8_9BURK|nr:hypothetical protein R70211_06837 [Paraburkholderia domus]